MEQKFDIPYLKQVLYSGILCDVLDQKGYRNQALSNEIMGLRDETVIFGPAFTSIGTEVYSMPPDPLTAQCKVVDQLGKGRSMYWSPGELQLRRVWRAVCHGGTGPQGRRRAAGCLQPGYEGFEGNGFPCFTGERTPRPPRAAVRSTSARSRLPSTA